MKKHPDSNGIYYEDDNFKMFEFLVDNIFVFFFAANVSNRKSAFK